MARFDSLNEDVLEAIFKHSCSQPDDLRSLASYCLICRKTRYAAQRLLYRHLGLVTSRQWYTADKLLQELGDPDKAACVRSITLAGPGSFDWVRQYEQHVTFATRLVQICQPQHVTLTGTAEFLERIINSNLDLAGVVSLNINLFDSPCEIDALVRLINSAAESLCSLAITSHNDGPIIQKQTRIMSKLRQLRKLSLDMKGLSKIMMLNAVGRSAEQLHTLTIEGGLDYPESQVDTSLFESLRDIRLSGKPRWSSPSVAPLLAAARTVDHLWLTPATGVDGFCLPHPVDSLHVRPLAFEATLPIEWRSQILRLIRDSEKINTVFLYLRESKYISTIANLRAELERHGTRFYVRDPDEFVSLPSEHILSEDLVEGCFLPAHQRNQYNYANSRPFSSWSIRDLASSFSSSPWGR